MTLCNKSPAALLLILAPALFGFTEKPLGEDPAAGERLAVRWCGSCHLVKPDQSQANVDAPSFSAIARKQDFNAEAVATFLLVPHQSMPDYSLSRIEARAISSYIASLAKAAP